jgi:antitoxin VapB
MAFHVRDRETDALVRKLAAQKGVGLTEAVRLAVTAEIERKEADVQVRLKKIKALTDEIAKRPRTGLKADKAFFDDLYED